jgi:hypothetical protein
VGALLFVTDDYPGEPWGVRLVGRAGSGSQTGPRSKVFL